eukprot:TRINITY_DN28551_c0_g2_i1.p2 TRINITY_DN28551_c0_g2~~TRINITY_DN28551_c0_g2_i1.p2  ORF type:complete len:134 (-),score=24.95 TRINITY_DN28551_c0_g2_i1:125-526(-)
MIQKSQENQQISPQKEFENTDEIQHEVESQNQESFSPLAEEDVYVEKFDKNETESDDYIQKVQLKENQNNDTDYEEFSEIYQLKNQSFEQESEDDDGGNQAGSGNQGGILKNNIFLALFLSMFCVLISFQVCF